MGIAQTLSLLAMTAVTSSLAAQTFGAPSAAYIYDAPGTQVRRMIGVAGSAFLSDPVLSGLRFASVAPNGTAALAVWPDRVEWIPDLNAYPQGIATITGALPNADQVIWNRKSSAAALFASADGQVRFVRFAEGAPTLQNAAAPAWCGGSLQLLAADPDNALAAVTCAAAPGLFLLASAAAAAPISLPDAPAAAVFTGDGALYVAGGQAGIFLIRNPASGTAAEALFTEADLTSASTALFVASDLHLLYSADATQQHIRVYDLNTRQKIDDLLLSWQPTQLQPFGASSFLVNTRSVPTDPVIVFRTTPQRAVSFVPAGGAQ